MRVRESYIKEAEKVLLHTYNRFPIIWEKGEGVYLYDTEGKKYLDFAAGIAVFAFGYGNQEYNHSLKEQIDKMIHTSNYYYNIPAIEAAKKIVNASGMDRVFFTNSGAEAIEGAIKLARKYAFLKDPEKNELIAMNHSFHGRSMGALSVTGNPKYQDAFYPLVGGIQFANYNDFQSVKEMVSDKTCGILLETIQGEGGIYPAKKEFLEDIRALCDEKDIVMILDEIQCGMGRCGSMFAWQDYQVKPDIMTCAKALGCGFPVGAFVATEKVGNAMVPGDHGTTYGGNPLAGAAVNQVFELFDSTHILSHVKEVSVYLEQKLDELMNEFDFIIERRGKGFMQGLEMSVPVSKYVSKALEEGLVLISAGTYILRFVPPLIITREDIDEMSSILRKVLRAAAIHSPAKNEQNCI